MLIETDINELGDKRLSPEEGLIQAREESLRMAAKFRIDGQTELEDIKKALGNPMSYQELIRRVTKANPTIIVEESSVLKSIALRVPAVNEEGVLEKKYITGFYKEVLPEFSYVIVDDRNLPKREVRGWRTVLMHLIRQNVLTFSQATALFGDAEGQRSGRWHRTLQGWKDK